MPYAYEGPDGRQSLCNLDVMVGPQGATLVICSERADNPGADTTKAAVRIAVQLCRERPEIDPELMIWIEHYPERVFGEGDSLAEAWSQVEFQYNARTRTFTDPQWKRTTVDIVGQLWVQFNVVS